MSTMRRAREHLALAQDAFADGIPPRDRLVTLRLKLATWGDHITTLQENPHARLTATWLFGASCLCGSIWELNRFEGMTGSQLTHTLSPSIAIYIKLSLLNAKSQCDQWEASEIASEAPEAEPVRENGRVSGIARTATIRHTCGCESTLRLTGCSDATWRAAVSEQAARPCSAHKIAAEQDALTPAERAKRAETLWE